MKQGEANSVLTGLKAYGIPDALLNGKNECRNWFSEIDATLLQLMEILYPTQ